MSKNKKTIPCGTINPNTLKIAGKPNRAMTPEVKLAPVWVDRKNDYRRHKEKQKLRRYSDEYGNGGIFLSVKISGNRNSSFSPYSRNIN
ncbi:hypothetical protein [Sporomusa acidovorans]|uniref:Uncharacterized protein n=1 Tax=Sporomusa acidovorans (strain ATCC 49682 / DSM 3132 / Mol) TaxID=1123286 RepID=A0ABZ3IZC1_SPOA4|nr:hypothetical protein [Sporomusa acidovorans]OZC18312.1 hypothetical protein SPACI_34740 [Sporomusa acidovorans DSM 3132]SDF20328.1 hypothetical protein SAMN04488499_103735 [Sporomusa acidovorans]